MQAQIRAAYRPRPVALQSDWRSMLCSLFEDARHCYSFPTDCTSRVACLAGQHQVAGTMVLAASRARARPMMATTWICSAVVLWRPARMQAWTASSVRCTNSTLPPPRSRFAHYDAIGDREGGPSGVKHAFARRLSGSPRIHRSCLPCRWLGGIGGNRKPRNWRNGIRQATSLVGRRTNAGLGTGRHSQAQHGGQLVTRQAVSPSLRPWTGATAVSACGRQQGTLWRRDCGVLADMGS